MTRIRDVRKKARMTMKELGQIVGVSESTISLYETGKREPDNRTLVLIATALGVTTDFLLGLKEEPASYQRGAFRLKSLRAEKGFTQQDIADILNVSTAAVGRYERGEREMSYSQLITVADYLDSSIDYLLGRVDVNVTNKNAPPALAEGAVRKTITLEGGLPSDAEWLREFVQSEIQKAIQGDSQS